MLELIKKALIPLIAIIVLLAFFMLKGFFSNPTILLNKLFEKPVKFNNANFSFSKDKTYATWVWASPDELGTDEVNTKISEAHSEGFNTIYLFTGKYTDIAEESDPLQKKQDLANFEKSVKYFLETANQSGIKVEGLSGDTNWAGSDKEYIPLELLQYTLDYNKKNDVKFSGIQFDIEFYRQADFQTNSTQESTDYLTMVDNLARTLSKNAVEPSDFRLGFDLTYWLDNERGNVPPLDYNGSKKFVIYHVEDKLNGIPNSYLLLMAYRNKASGNGGSIKAIQNEIDYAKKSAPHLGIIVGQESGQVPDVNTVSFSGKSKLDLKTEIQKIADSYSGIPNLIGFAVHDLDNYMKLK